MNSMFYSVVKFNQPHAAWNVSQVRDMSYMFFRAENFNQPLAAWIVSQVRDMNYMFYDADQFYQPETLEKFRRRPESSNSF